MLGQLPETKELRKLYVTEGLTLREIARRFGVTHQAVYFGLVNAGIKRRPKGVPYPPLDRKELHRLYVTEGLNIRQTADRLGVSPSFVSQQHDLVV